MDAQTLSGEQELQVFYLARSEWHLDEQLEYTLLFRWFVGFGMDEAVWDASSFSTNRDRLVQADGGDFHGQTRTHDTHASRIYPEARSYRKSPRQEAKLAYLGHALMDHRHGLVVNACVTQACGTVERDAAGVMIDRIKTTTELTLARRQRATTRKPSSRT